MESISLAFTKPFLQQARLTTAHFYPCLAMFRRHIHQNILTDWKDFFALLLAETILNHQFTNVLRFFFLHNPTLSTEDVTVHTQFPISLAFVSFSTQWERLSFASSVKQIIFCSLFSYSSIISVAENRLTTGD